EQTEGPYYIANEAVRRNITEGRPGTPLLLRAFVVNASTCKPIKGAAVDIWHADAGGVYSGFGQGAASRTFMRGIQRTNARGLAVFRSGYPGWYQGRTVHIHVKVHLGVDRMTRRELLARGGRVALVAGAVPFGPRLVELASAKSAGIFEELAHELRGDLVRPGAAGYDQARVLFDTRFDAVAPRAVVFCESLADVER